MARNRYKELGDNTALFAISSFGSKFVSFLLLPLYTAVLSTSDYGIVDLMSNTVSLLIPLFTLNVQDAVLRYGLGQDAEPKEILSVGIRMVVRGSCVLFVALVLMTGLGIAPVGYIYLIFLMTMFVLNAFSNVITMYVKSQNYVQPLVISGIGNTLITSVSAIFLLVVVKMGVMGYMVSITLGSLFAVVYLSFVGKIQQGITTSARVSLMHSMIAFSAPLIANSLAWWVNDISDRWVVTLIWGTAANGIYAVAYKIPSVLSTLQTIFYNAWSISAVKEYDPEDRDGFLGRTYEVYSGTMAICCSGIILLDVPLASFLYSNEFFEAWRYVPLLLVGVLLNGLTLFEGCLFTAAKNTKAVSITTLIGAIVSIGSCVVLTITVGPIGAAIATLLGYMVSWVSRTHVMFTEVASIRVSWGTELITLTTLIVQAFIAIQEGMQILQIPLTVLIIFLRRKQLVSIWIFVMKKLGK